MCCVSSSITSPMTTFPLHFSPVTQEGRVDVFFQDKISHGNLIATEIIRQVAYLCIPFTGRVVGIYSLIVHLKL